MSAAPLLAAAHPAPLLVAVHPLPLLAALALGAWLVRRRARLSKLTLAAGAIVAAALLAFGIGAVPTPDVQDLASRAGEALGRWTYLVVAVLAFLETGAFVGLVAPGETAVILGGVIAGQGVIDPVVLIAFTWAAAVLGDLTSYTLGRRLGRDFLLRHGPRLRITPERLERVEGFFARRGGATIVIGRFLGLVRALAPFIAGASRMPIRRFVPYDVIGAGLWSALFVVLGYLFWQSLDQVTQYVGRGAFALGTLAALLAAGVFAHRLAHDPALRARTRHWIERQAERPVLRPLARVAAPVWRIAGRPLALRAAGPARFVVERLTPGQLGLELTTLLAIAAAGGFAFAVLGLQVEADRLLPGDRIAFDLVDRLRADWLDDAVRVATELGAFQVSAAAIGATAAWTAWRGRATDSAALVAGLLLALVAVGLAKHGFGRPRPLDAVMLADGHAYPSGHTAYATAYVACAVVLVRAGSSFALRLGGVTLGLAVLVFVALTRVYLRVHHLSDVVGGAALGLAAFAACGIVALVVDFMRHNGEPSG